MKTFMLTKWSQTEVFTNLNMCFNVSAKQGPEAAKLKLLGSYISGLHTNTIISRASSGGVVNPFLALLCICTVGSYPLLKNVPSAKSGTPQMIKGQPLRSQSMIIFCRPAGSECFFFLFFFFFVCLRGRYHPSIYCMKKLISNWVGCMLVISNHYQIQVSLSKKSQWWKKRANCVLILLVQMTSFYCHYQACILQDQCELWVMGIYVD